MLKVPEIYETNHISLYHQGSFHCFFYFQICNLKHQQMQSHKFLSSFSKSIHLLERRMAQLEFELGFPSSSFGVSQTPTSLTIPPIEQMPGYGDEVIISQSDAQLFKRIDLRVGLIVQVEDNPSSHSSYYEKVDIGEPELRSIGTAIKDKVPIEDVRGLVCVCANVTKKKIGQGFKSHGFVMCSKTEEKWEFLRPPPGSKVGERVHLDGLKFQSTQYMKPLIKKKYMKRYLELLKTNENCEACFAGILLKTSAGVLKVDSLQNRHIL